MKEITTDQISFINNIAYELDSKTLFTGYEVGYDSKDRLLFKHSYKDGKLDGPWMSFYEDGQLSMKILFKEGIQHGPEETYYPNGQMKWKVNYNNGKKVGILKEFTKSGKLDYEILYVDGVEQENISYN